MLYWQRVKTAPPDSGFDDTCLFRGTLFDDDGREKQCRMDAVANQINEQTGAGRSVTAPARILAGKRPKPERHGASRDYPLRHPALTSTGKTPPAFFAVPLLRFGAGNVPFCASDDGTQ
jgi:hypothetical protein